MYQSTSMVLPNNERYDSSLISMYSPPLYSHASLLQDTYKTPSPSYTHLLSHTTSHSEEEDNPTLDIPTVSTPTLTPSIHSPVTSPHGPSEYSLVEAAEQVLASTHCDPSRNESIQDTCSYSLLVEPLEIQSSKPTFVLYPISPAPTFQSLSDNESTAKQCKNTRSPDSTTTSSPVDEPRKMSLSSSTLYPSHDTTQPHDKSIGLSASLLDLSVADAIWKIAPVKTITRFSGLTLSSPSYPNHSLKSLEYTFNEFSSNSFIELSKPVIPLSSSPPLLPKPCSDRPLSAGGMIGTTPLTDAIWDSNQPEKQVKPSSRRGTKQHVCPYPGCGRVFHRSYNLKSHILCHSGEKPHQCPCGSSFARKHDLQRHCRTIHKSMPPPYLEHEK